MYFVYRFAQIIALSLPRKLAYKLAELIADFQFFFSAKDREAVLYNLKPFFSNDKDLRKAAKNNLRNFAKYLTDFLNLNRLNSFYIKKYIKIENLEYLKKAKQENKGIVIFTAHIGNWELGAAVTSLIGFEVYAIALPHKNKKTNEFFNRQRKSGKVKIIPTGIAVRRVFSLLKNQKIVAFVADREFGQGGVVMPCCGKKAIFPKGPAVFASKTGAIMVPAFLVRTADKYFKLIFGKPIKITKDNGQKKSVEELIKEYSSVIGSYIARYPEQWYVFQKYWVA